MTFQTLFYENRRIMFGSGDNWHFSLRFQNWKCPFWNSFHESVAFSKAYGDTVLVQNDSKIC